MSRYTICVLILKATMAGMLIASDGNAQTTKGMEDVFLSLELKNKTLKQVFEQITELTDFKFAYEEGRLAINKRISLEASNTSLKKVLLGISRKNKLSFRRVGDQIFVVRHTGDPLVEDLNTKADAKITGKVTDENGEGLPGASILAKGTTIGTTSGLDGTYQLKVPDNAILVISFVGYKTQEIPLNGQSVIDVQLQPDAEQLDEIVVVGFGTQKKESVVGSMTSVKPAELKVPASNLTSALAGRISGVIAYQRSGEPGADNAQFFVRGVTTFAAEARPLILIDGVELTQDDLARLNPDDIESFSVLKDATATAVYGARGANGIIYVTTKKGEVGKAKVSLRFEQSFSQNTSLPEFADPVTYMRLNNEAVRTRLPGERVPYSAEQIDGTINRRNPNVFPVVDWQDEILQKTAKSQRFNFNVRGGGEVAQYYIAGGFTRDAGILKKDNLGADNNVNLDRYLIRSNISINLSPTTNATVRLNATLDNLTGPAVPGNGAPGSNAFNRVINASPVRFPAIYEPDSASMRLRNRLFGNQIASTGNALYINPVAELVSGFQRSSNAFSLIQIDLNQDLSAITQGLRFRFLGNTNRTSYFKNTRGSRPFWYNAPLDTYNRLTDEYTLTPLNQDIGDESLSFLGFENAVTNVLYTEFAFNYDRTFAEKHTASGMVVGIAREFLDGAVTNLELSLPSRNLGVSGRFTYSYDDRYFAEFNFGYNGSERFAKGNRFGFFPSFGAGWIVSNEKFFEGLSNTFSRFKIRGSYGLVGNDAIGSRSDRFFYLSNVNPRSGRGYVFGSGGNTTFSQGVSINRYANPEIAWEVGIKYNLGVELNMLDDAIQIRADYFEERRKDILNNRVVPHSLGLQAQGTSPERANLGEAHTKGVDASLELNKYINNDFWITSRVNFTYANGKIIKQEQPNYALQNAPGRSSINTKIGQQFGFIAERLFIDDEDVRSSAVQSFPDGPPTQAGDIKYRDVNEDGVISDLDRVPIGNPTTPQVTYGLGVSLGYKNFDISAFVQGVGETSLFIDPSAIAPFTTRNVAGFSGTRLAEGSVARTIGESALLQSIVDDRWSEENPNIYAFYPRLSSDTPSSSDGVLRTNNAQTSTWWLRDGSFARLKQVEIGYTVRPKNASLGSLRFYATGTNLLVWSKFKLWDPELGGNGFGYPLQRVFNLGILANF